MKERLIREIRREVNLLDSWIRNVETGGWSTQNLEAMKTRRNELKALLYDVDNEATQWCKS